MKATEEIYGIGIESSCDESSVAIVKNGSTIIADPIYSQISLHATYGGIVPENASRAHLEKLPVLLQHCLSALPGSIENLAYIAVTLKPGLTGSLLVGYNTALALAHAAKKPLIPVHHLEAHLSAILLENRQFTYPCLGVLLSGGNSAIYRIDDAAKITVLAETQDDAAGEALDKAAARLNLPYPGGPEIEKRAQAFREREPKNATKPGSNPFPVILRSNTEEHIRFSFSGIKTALINVLADSENNLSTDAICYFYQQRIIEHICANLSLALRKTKLKQVIAAGGVMSNSALQQAMQQTCNAANANLLVPGRKYCTDNAAMVAACGYRYFKAGLFPEQFFAEPDNKFIFTRERATQG